MNRFTAVELVILFFTITVCLLVLMTGISWALRGAQSVPDSARDYMKDILFLMINTCALYIGYVLNKKQDSQPPQT